MSVSRSSYTERIIAMLGLWGYSFYKLNEVFFRKFVLSCVLKVFAIHSESKENAVQNKNWCGSKTKKTYLHDLVAEVDLEVEVVTGLDYLPQVVTGVRYRHQDVNVNPSVYEPLIRDFTNILMCLWPLLMLIIPQLIDYLPHSSMTKIIWGLRFLEFDGLDWDWAVTTKYVVGFWHFDVI